jgi:RNA polymerase sigma-70 factor (ECF subfamily)
MDEHLTDSCGRADEAAVNTDPERWLSEHGDYLFGYAFLRLGNREQAEEAVQDALLAALESRHRFEGRSSERTWLVAILRHKVIDRIGTLSRERQHRVATDSEGAPVGQFDAHGHWKREPARWREDPKRLLERKEFRSVLEQCIAALPARRRQAFALRQMDGLSSEEVCKAMGISRTNLWVMLHRARLQLRDCLEQNWFGCSDAERTP